MLFGVVKRCIARGSLVLGAVRFGIRRCGVDLGGKFHPKSDGAMPSCSVQRSIRASGRVCAECNGASAHPGESVQRATTQSGTRTGLCGVLRGIRAFGRGCAACSDPVGRAGRSLQSAARHSFTGNGSLQRALGHPVTGNALVFSDLLQRHAGVAFPKTRSGRWRIPACLVASKRGSRKRRKTEPKGFLRIFPSAFSDLFVSQADDSREWVSSLGFECPWPRVIFCFLLCRYVAAAKWREYE